MRKIQRFACWAAALFLTFVLQNILRAEIPQYIVTDVGTLGGSSSYASAINNSGQIVGRTFLPSDPNGYEPQHAFLYSNGKMTDFAGSLGSPTQGADVNNSGSITGVIGSIGPSRAFIYSSGSTTILGTLGGLFSFGASINDSGQVTGNSSIDSYDSGHAFLYSGGTMSDLGTLGGDYSSGTGINDLGQITGCADTSSGAQHAFLYSNGVMSDLGTLGGDCSYGYGINNAGNITGYSIISDDPYRYHAFLYSGGVMRDLGTLGGFGSVGRAINKSGQVVGLSYLSDNSTQHAFLYSDGVMYDLNDCLISGTGITIIAAQGINDSGQIAANGIVNGTPHALLLTPNVPVLSITPKTNTSFGTKLIGTVSERTFVIKNNGSTSISGEINLDSPFSISGSNTYNLAPGQSQSITVRFTPASPGAYTSYITFSRGRYSPCQISAAAIADPEATTGAITGTITTADGTPLNDFPVKAESAASNMFNSGGGYLTKSGIVGGSSGRFTLRGLPPGTYHLTVSSLNPQLYGKEISGITVSAGQTASVNIVLAAVPPANQPPTTLSAQDTPVVIVRGAGTDQNWDSGENDYWWSLVGKLLNNGFTQIWECNNPEDGILNSNGQKGHFINGEKSIQTNADSLRQYILEKATQYKNHNGYYPPQINLIGHSMGGLIIRCALNGKENLEFNDPITGQPIPPIAVKKVVMLGTPNAGSVLADYAVGFSIDQLKNYDFFPLIFRPSWASTHDLTTHFIRNEFNGSYRLSTNVQLFLFAGTGGCYTLDLSLAGGDLIMQELNIFLPPEQVDDGAVTQSSVEGVYHYRTLPFLTCTSQTSLKATPTVPLVTDQSIGAGFQDHFSMLSDSKTLNWVVSKLTGTTLDQSAPSLRETLGSVDLAATSETASAPMQLIAQNTGVLMSGSTIAIPVISDAATTLRIRLLTSGTDVVLRLQKPEGGSIDATTSQSDSNVQYGVTLSGSGAVVTYQITNPSTGVWTAIVDGTGMTAPSAGFSLMAFGDSNIAFIPQTDQLFGQGQDVVVTCALADLASTTATPIQAASITPVVKFPDGSTTTMTLLDDGLHNDGAPNDGVYAAVLPNVQQAGEYSVTYTATAQNSQGQSLQRVAIGGFSISTGNGNILGDPVYSTIHTSDTSMANYVQVSCWVKPKVSGTYILSGQLAATSGTIQFTDSESFTSDGSAASTVNLLFDLNKIRAAGGIGQFHITDLQLFEVNSRGSAWLDAYHGTSTFQIGPNITALPQNTSPEEGTGVTFSVTADSGNITYQWQFNGAPIAGATNAMLNIPLVTGPQAGAYSVIVTNETGTITTQPGTLTITPATSFTHWRQARFSADQLNTPEVSAATADPTNSGIANLLKYAFNSDPFATDRSILPTSTTQRDAGDGKTYPAFTYKQRISNTDLNYVVEVSDDLITWDASGTQIEPIEPPTPTGDGVTQQLNVRIKTPLNNITKKFMRLRVIKN